MIDEIKVVHIDTEKGWRGGQQQAAYLHESLVKQNIKSILVCQPESKFHDYCIEKRLPVNPIRMLGEIDIISAFRIASYARSNGYNIIHAHSSHAMSIGLFVKYFFQKIKLIAVRRVDFHIQKNFFSKLKYNSKKIDKIVCISDEIKRVLLSDRVNSDKLIAIHSGIDINKFDNVAPLTSFRQEIKSENKIIIGTVAAFAGHKDYPNLLKAAKIVLEKRDNIKFLSLGDGPLENEIKQLHKELNLKDDFIFLGFKNNVGEYLKHFDIFVLASKREGLGTSILDAQSVGLPVVACKIGGIPEVVKNEENGLLVPPRDPKALAKAILKLVRNGELRNKFSRAALNTIKEFDIQITVAKNIELYKKLLCEF
jgi:glycosyltransferase involved in cell wall biosynthesis